MNLKDRIKYYLSEGTAPGQVATIVGCSPGYVSQLLADKAFKSEVEAAIVAGTEGVEEDQRLGKKLETFEHVLVGSLVRDTENATYMERIKALDTVSKVRHERAIRQNPGAFQPTTNMVVQVQLPAHQVQALTLPADEIQRNTKNEIVAIGSRSLSSMGADGVRSLFASKVVAKQDSAAAIEAELFPMVANK